MAKNPKYSIDKRVTWAQAVRDLGIKSMNTGQFPFFCLFLLSFVIVLSLPAHDLSTLLRRLAGHLVKFELLAYILWFGTIAGWYFHAKYVRKAHAEEYRRIASEKTYLQELLNQNKFNSSEE
ncbi:MAG: hypothetical protein JJU35_03800 [Balneolales bacterium]|nr:hypothetical protein [Balneolales bacterium]